MNNKDNNFLNSSDEKIENIIFKETINNVKSYIYIKDTEGNYIFINQAARALFYPYNKLYGKTDEDLYNSIRNEKTHSKDLEILTSQQQVSKLEEIILPQNNEKHTFITTKTPVFDTTNKLIGLCSISRDITIETEALKTLNEIEKKFYTITEHTNVGIYTIENDKLTYVNPKCCEMSGYTFEELTTLKLSDIIHPYDLKLTQDNIEKRLSGKEQHTDYIIRLICKDKSIIKTQIHGAVTTINDKQIVIGTISDITDYLDNQEKILRQASYDQLTGLPNRYLLNKRLNISLAQSKRKNFKLAVLFIDLDRFKYINDTLGHNTGDKLLIQVARRLKRILRSSDLITRLGGDEFIIVLEQINSTYEPAEVANKVITSLRSPFTIDKQDLYIGASIGISIFPDNGTSNEDLIKNADSAMYEAKQKGKGQFSFYNKILTEISTAELNHINNLRTALEKNQLYVYYQPQINIQSHDIICLEALIGWHHPTKGNIFPAKFIPLATESGLTVQIDLWVVDTTLSQIKRWLKSGRNINRIAINISNTNLSLSNFAKQIHELLEKHHIPANLIELYFQQETFLKNSQLNEPVLNKLKKMGISIATSFKTKIQLLRLDADSIFNKIKIDYAALNSIKNNRKKEIVIKLITDFAEIEEYEIVLENINLSSDAEYIMKKGFNYAQGNFYIPPVPPEQITNDYFIPSDSKKSVIS